MRRNAVSLETLVIPVAWMLLAGCSSPSAGGKDGATGTPAGADASKGGASAAGASTGGASVGERDRMSGTDAGGEGTPPPPDLALRPSETGHVVNDALGITGDWYVFADSLDDDGTLGGTCQKNARLSTDACSRILTPDIAETATKGFPPSDAVTGAMCTSGFVARIVPTAANSTNDFINIWGAGIGLDFNHPDPHQPAQEWNGVAHHVIGLSFDIDAVPSGFRVELTTTPDVLDLPLWGAPLHGESPAKPGKNVVMLSDVGGPAFLPADQRVPPDWTKMLSLRFHVVSGTAPAAARPFAFCISNLKMLVQ